MDGEQVAAAAHVVAASSALFAGAVVLMRTKGTPAHRTVGTLYVVALGVVNLAALSLHRESAFGVFHVLAVASLVTIAVGVSPLLLGRRSARVIAVHAYCMTWSYAGLAAAGFGQLAVAADRDGVAWVSPVVIGVVLLAGGATITVRVPAALGRVLSD